MLIWINEQHDLLCFSRCFFTAAAASGSDLVNIHYTLRSCFARLKVMVSCTFESCPRSWCFVFWNAVWIPSQTQRTLSCILFHRDLAAWSIIIRPLTTNLDDHISNFERNRSRSNQAATSLPFITKRCQKKLNRALILRWNRYSNFELKNILTVYVDVPLSTRFEVDIAWTEQRTALQDFRRWPPWSSP